MPICPTLRQMNKGLSGSGLECARTLLVGHGDRFPKTVLRLGRGAGRGGQQFPSKSVKLGFPEPVACQMAIVRRFLHRFERGLVPAVVALDVGQ